MARVDGLGGERGRKKALDLLAEIEQDHAAAREGDGEAFARAVLAEMGAVLALSGQRPWIGAGDEATEVYRMAGAGLVAGLARTLRASVEQQGQLASAMREIGKVR